MPWLSRPGCPLVRGTHEWNRVDQIGAILGRVVDTTERGNPTMSDVSLRRYLTAHRLG